MIYIVNVVNSQKWLIIFQTTNYFVSQPKEIKLQDSYRNDYIKETAATMHSSADNLYKSLKVSDSDSK